MVICPICQSRLNCEKQRWHCENNHSFDVARQGYVNLLPVQQKHSLTPGDTKEMVAARRAFLDGGYYLPIAKTLRSLVDALQPKTILDAGCGEGYYLSHLTHIPERWGIDISKDAVRFAAVRDKAAHWLTATAAHLPFEAQSFDCVLSMFAFTAEAEFQRVLKENGYFIQVLAGKDHLLGLKRIIYPTVFDKEKNIQPSLHGFTLIKSQTLCFDFELNNAQTVHDLLYMTPHVHRIGKDGAQALAQTSQLFDRAEVIFNVYQVDKSSKIC
ncbi:MAG: methyltransferase domain-containing protein [Ruminococcaceae bacterium]|nr:methyltransferase domain-containing protein [Oscillospiraceae bacterium]